MFRIHLSKTSLLSILTVSVLYIYYLIALLVAIRSIGPVRTLLATFAQPVVVSCIYELMSISQPGSRRRVSLFCLLFVVIAVAFLAYDGTGGQAPGRRAARVRDRVLQTAAGKAVDKRLRRLSDSVQHQVLKKGFVKLKQRYGKVEENQIEKPFPEGDERNDADPVDDEISNGEGNTNANGSIKVERERRRLLSIVKDEQILAFQNDTSNRASWDKNEQNVQQKSENGLSNDDSQKKTRTPLIDVILAITFAMTASLNRLIATNMRFTSSENIDMPIPFNLIFMFCSILLFPLFGIIRFSASYYNQQQISPVTLNFLFGCGGVGFLFFLLPCLIDYDRKRRLNLQLNKSTNRTRPVGLFHVVNMNTLHESSNVFQSFVYLLIISKLAQLAGLQQDSEKEKISFSVFLTATILAAVSLMVTPTHSKLRKHNSTTSRPYTRASNRTDISAELKGNLSFNLKTIVHDVKKVTNIIYLTVSDLTTHARSNKASWQVLNFLVLQFGMAIIELIYATAANSASLFSVSADNFFCGVALAIGLFSIRASTGKPSQTYPYGLARVESVSGFSNGVILIYVAVLVVLESYERACDKNDIATGQAFSVCILGTIGNVLGLLFFPPESRRENHNVQGIYLHIWANTLAFASMATTTAITAAKPDWKSMDIMVSCIVAICVVFMAIPLLIRSARVLLLLQPKSTELIVSSAREQLSQIHGVSAVSSLRVWNLTPNSLIGSVRLSVSEESQTSDTDVLLRARTVFASIGIPASQCTIQVSTS